MTATALAVGGVIAYLGSAGAGASHPKMVLADGEGFVITGQLSSSPTSLVPDALYPGTQRYVYLTVSNSQDVAITVSRMAVAMADAGPANCPAASNLDLHGATFTGALLVPAHGTSATAVPVSLLDTGADQDGCQGATFNFVYSGTATYTEVYATSTTVGSGTDPSFVGQRVAYTATVTAQQGTNQDPVPSSPTGSVTFLDGSTVVCADVPVASLSTATASATCTPSAYQATSIHSITAQYSDGTGDGNFSASASAPLVQMVNPAPTTTTLGASPAAPAFGQPVVLTATVAPSLAPPPPAPTGAVSFYMGSSTGAHRLLGTTTLTTPPAGSPTTARLTTAGLPPGPVNLYATYNGDTNYTASAAPAITENVGFSSACLLGTFNGGYAVHAGQSICFGSGSVINGGITVQAGGALSVTGSTVNGGIASAGAAALRVCGSIINGTLGVTGSAGLVTVGDGGDDGPPGCAGSTVNGSATLSANSGGVELGADTFKGTVTISANTLLQATGEDAAEVEGNTISGSLSCPATNNPALSDGGQRNTVSGARSGQCAAVTF